MEFQTQISIVRSLIAGTPKAVRIAVEAALKELVALHESRTQVAEAAKLATSVLQDSLIAARQPEVSWTVLEIKLSEFIFGGEIEIIERHDRLTAEEAFKQAEEIVSGRYDQCCQVYHGSKLISTIHSC